MTRDRMTLDQLEARRALAVRNLSLGKRGYAMKAIVAHDVLTQDVPALLAVARAAERLFLEGDEPDTAVALQVALIALYAPKRLVTPEGDADG